MVIGRDTRTFLDRENIRHAIEMLERKTTVPIHVAIAPYFWGSVRHAAELALKRYRSAGAPHGTGVLFFIVPTRKRFIIVGDRAVHEKIGQRVWDQVAMLMEERFRAGDPTAGVLCALEELGTYLIRDFPVAPSERISKKP